MQVFLDGDFVDSTKASVSVFDRSFLYGDGLFETIRVHRGKPFCLARHLERLEHGAADLGIALPSPRAELASFALRLIETNAIPESLLRITLSRGVGERGYSPVGANRPTLVMTMHPLAASNGSPQWRLITSTIRLPARDLVSGHKTNNKLRQILARAEATKAGADEALLLNTNGHMAEGSACNFFWVHGGTIRTAPQAAGILRGITREIVFELCDKLKFRRVETAAPPESLKAVDGAFATLSSLGIVEVFALDDTPIPSSGLVSQLQQAYRELLQAECSG